MIKVRVYVTIVLCASFCVAKELAKYIKPCSLSDPALEECMIRHGYEAIPAIVKGDKNFNVPNMQPLKLDKVDFNAGNLRIVVTNLEVYGLETAKILSTRYDQKSQTIFMNIKLPRVDLKGQYKTMGRILLLPIEGNGPMEIILRDGQFNCSATLENFYPGAKEYIKLKDTSVQFYVKDSHYDLQNLFNGNKQLGDNINRVLNDNHDALNKDFNGVFAETINTVVKAILSGTTDGILFDQVFLP